ncbi:uncharacterized protein LOC129600629 [Paramacrobiotus metropolitanus]|uniref:uncharacterized protein LOC129600629 n=1 Tax=Paramacrobiotus metropolitanus TaxID=2943436 RepID=UPI002445803A|nr:uncharacterized protein LOC129600629 [Paramacrobiotus metropolitanus]
MANIAFLLCASVLLYACSVHCAPKKLKTGCLDCEYGVCDDGQHQTCDTDQERCVCPPARSSPAKSDRREKGAHRGAASTEEQTGQPPRGSGAASTEEQTGRRTRPLSGCIDCGYNMCSNGPMRCNREKNQCECRAGGFRS